MSDNDPFSRRWRLEMSIRVVSIPRETDSTEDMIDVLHCFAPNPLGCVPLSGTGGEKALLATSGEMIDPTMLIRLLDNTTRDRARDGDYEELGYLGQVGLNLHVNDEAWRYWYGNAEKNCERERSRNFAGRASAVRQSLLHIDRGGCEDCLRRTKWPREGSSFSKRCITEHPRRYRFCQLAESSVRTVRNKIGSSRIGWGEGRSCWMRNQRLVAHHQLKRFIPSQLARIMQHRLADVV
jgi:hypothetical protein